MSTNEMLSAEFSTRIQSRFSISFLVLELQGQTPAAIGAVTPCTLRNVLPRRALSLIGQTGVRAANEREAPLSRGQKRRSSTTIFSRLRKLNQNLH